MTWRKTCLVNGVEVEAVRIDDALHRATIAFADELRIGGSSDDMAWRAADRAMNAAPDFLARGVRT